MKRVIIGVLSLAFSTITLAEHFYGYVDHLDKREIKQGTVRQGQGEFYHVSGRVNWPVYHDGDDTTLHLFKFDGDLHKSVNGAVASVTMYGITADKNQPHPINNAISNEEQRSAIFSGNDFATTAEVNSSQPHQFTASISTLESADNGEQYLKRQLVTGTLTYNPDKTMSFSGEYFNVLEGNNQGN